METVTVKINGEIVQAVLVERYLDGDCRVMYRGTMYVAAEVK